MGLGLKKTQQSFFFTFLCSVFGVGLSAPKVCSLCIFCVPRGDFPCRSQEKVWRLKLTLQLV